MSPDPNEDFLSLVVSAISNAHEWQHGDGSFPAGHNGPYHDPETRVRNTAHWLIANLHAWRATGDSRFKRVAERALGWLLDGVGLDPVVPVECRRKPGKDATNGVIGQAWIIEALAEAAWILGDERASRAGKKLFLLHPYCGLRHAWFRVSMDGNAAGFDRTFNHQLWFCAVGALLVRSGAVEVRTSVADFIDNLSNDLPLYRSGLIYHAPAFYLTSGLLGRAKSTIRLADNEFRGRRRLYRKSLGYHAFNIYALALIEEAMPGGLALDNQRLNAVVEYTFSESYRNSVEESPYGYAYNPPGFETSYAAWVVKGSWKDVANSLLRVQIEKTYNHETGQFDRGVADPWTSAARVYEAARLLGRS